MDVVSSNAWRTFVIAIFSAIAVQTTAMGAVWVDTNGNTVSPALGNQTILLQIP